MNKRKRYLTIVLFLILLVSSSIFAIAEGDNNNLYPHPQPGLSTIKDQVLYYGNQNNYIYDDIILNGAGVDGRVIFSYGNEKGVERLYTLEVKEAGMVSINLSTHNYLDKGASLYVYVCMNDPRTASNTVGYNNDIQITLTDEPDHPYVEKNSIYYAYPGTYYLYVRGNDRSGSDYIFLDYTISATQEIYKEQYGTSMGNISDPDYPNYLGTTTLSESLSIKGTKGMLNWRKRTVSGGLSGSYTNSYDYFTFTASKSGTVYAKLINHKTTILDTFLAAYHSRSNSTDFVPKLTLSILETSVGYPLQTESLYGETLNNTFEVKAGVSYRVDIGGSNHPMSYSLDLSYNQSQTGSDRTNTASTWAVNEINQSIEAGLQTTKMMNSDFKSYATREEFAELIMKLYDQLGGVTVSGGQNPFSDTSNVEIIRAKNAEIINGTSTTTFGPNEHITREQLCVMILRTLQVTDINYKMDTDFQKEYNDIDHISSWALNSVRILNSYEIINGSDKGLEPKETVTKEVAILMMYRAYELFK